MSKKKKMVPEDLKEAFDVKLPPTKKQPVVHSTFRLIPEAHEAIKELAKVYGKHADVFEIFVENLKNYEVFKRMVTAGVPESVARKVSGCNYDKAIAKGKKDAGKIRKTYVVKKDTLETLEKIKKQLASKRLKVSRDLLIENIALECKKQIDKKISGVPKLYREFLGDIKSLWGEAEKLKDKMIQELSFYDPLSLADKFLYIISWLDEISQDLETFLKEEDEDGEDN